MTCHPSSQPMQSSQQVQSSLDTSTLQPGLQSAIHALRTGDFQTRWDAAKTIPGYGAETIPLLIDLLHEDDADWELLWFVARILGSFEHPQAIAALVHLLSNTNNLDVTGMAATALANHGVVAIEPLAQLLQDDTSQLLAIQALAQIRHPEVIPPLLQLVHAPSPPSPAIYAAAIEALSHFYRPEISSALLAALENVNAIVRKAAVVGLSIQVEQFNKTELVRQLTPRLHDFDLSVCCQTAIALGRMGTPEAIEALSHVLHSPHTPLPLQSEIVRALGWIGTPAALEQLQPCLKTDLKVESSVATGTLSPSPHSLQHETIAVLGRVETLEAKRKATEILLAHLQTLEQSNLSNLSNPAATKTYRTQQEIAFSLGQLQQIEAIDPLIQLLAIPKATVRFHVISALKQFDATIAHDRLQQRSTEPNLAPELKRGIEIALQEWTN